VIRTTRHAAAFSVLVLALGTACCAGETVRLKATADIWVSAFRGEADHSAGKYKSFKLKSIQEMAVVRFDAAPAAGRTIRSARLLLHPDGEHMLRYVRVSTVSGDWVEGTNAARLTAGDGATFNHADGKAKRPWAWAGSQLCDVIMGAGNTLTTWAERKQLEDGWISVELTPELVYALVAGDSDGLALMEGGTPKFFNNFIHSVQSKFPPRVEVELGEPIQAAPPRPSFQASPDPQRAHLTTGAIKLTVAPAPGVVCWRVALDGKPVPRWKVAHPARKGPTTFYLEDLAPARKCELELVAVSPGGKASAPTKASVTASPALPAPPELGKFNPPTYRGPSAPKPDTQPGQAATRGARPFVAWVCPPLVKISPETGKVMFNDAGDKGDWRRSNAIRDYSHVRLFGARGEYVSYQVIVENRGDKPLKDLKVLPSPLVRPGATIARGQIELYKNWYARNANKQWQPAYCVPMKLGQGVEVPDPARKMADQKNQSFYVDIHIPKDAKPGRYDGLLTVEVGGSGQVIPVRLEVLDFSLPERLVFWPQLNAYQAPEGVHDYYRLAHNHRCVFYFRYWRPKVEGAGKNLRLIWDEYDKNVGPLLSGEAFAGCRRAGVPIEAVALPFVESWPTEMTKANYNYQGYWPGKGDSADHIVAHYMKAPYIGEAFSKDYLDAWHAAERQFIEHFREKGWKDTEMQAVFVSKNTHRIKFGVNMWWTTDEPYHWDDWLALQWYGRLWKQGLRGGEGKQWVCRADISRPQWQGRVLDGAVDTVYFGGAFGSPPMTRRCRTLARQAPLTLRVYGGANRDSASNLGSVVWILHAYLNGASAGLPWQTLGNDKSLDVNDSSVGGNALLAPGGRFGVSAVADMRLKAFRDAEQIAEYLEIVRKRYGLNHEQLRAMVQTALNLTAGTRAGASADNADALTFGKLKAWQLSELRRKLAELILKKP